MTTLLEMTLTGSILVMVVLILRRCTLNRIPKTALVVMWMVIVVRMLLPVRFIRIFYAGDTDSFMISMTSDYENVLTIIWLVGAGLGAVVLFASYAVNLRKFRYFPEANHRFVRSFQQSCRLKRTVAVKISDCTATPLVYGIIHPVILLPAGIDLENRKQLTYILRHEYIHIRKFDNLLKALANIAVCIHWFNPFAWVMRSYLSQDLELRCDEILLKESEGDCRTDYASTLIDIAEQRRQFLTSHSVGSAFADNAPIERIRAIMRFRPVPFVLKFSVVTVFMIAATGTVRTVTRLLSQWQGCLLVDGSLLLGQITLPALTCILTAYLMYRYRMGLRGKKQFSTMIILTAIYGTMMYAVWEALTWMQFKSGKETILCTIAWGGEPTFGMLCMIRLSELVLFGTAAACLSACICRRKESKRYLLITVVSVEYAVAALLFAVILLFCNMVMTGIVYGAP